MFNRRFRVIAVLVFVVGLGAVLVTLSAVSQWLDPGSKGDVSTDLVTPTFAVDGVRVFKVASAESQVDFVVRAYGLELNGVFPVSEGTITLEPVGDALRVIVRLHIHVDAVQTGSDQVTALLRGVMATGDYPLAFYVASSRGLVPVTEEVITFDLDGDLDVHNVPNTHSMRVEAQLVGGDMWAVATSALDLSRHAVEMPALFGSPTIELTARLKAYEIDAP